MKFRKSLLATFVAFACFSYNAVDAQLSGSVGPTTSTASKAAKKTCNVLNYGATASTSSDLGPALLAAFNACKTGGIVYVPPGSYGMSTWQTLNGGTGWALQLDGTIYRTGTAGGHMIIVQNANDFEFFSHTSKGAIQGYGYTFLSQNTYGPRLVRIVTSKNWSFHDIALVDSPAFHLILDNSSNGEVYNTIIRGANRGGLDGIDVSGSNIWIHDVEVTNKDECVTIKTPATNMLVQNIYCNWSGGSAFGSLGSGTAISNIQYSHIYTWQSNQMIMIKSNGGDGYVRDCSFDSFIGHSNAYALDINEYWTDRALDPGNGVFLSNLKFSNFYGTVVDPKRATIQVLCADRAPCTGISLSNINLYSDSGAACHYVCESAYGTGYCLRSGSGGAYTTTSSYSSAPAGATNAAKMPNDLPSGLGLSVSIAIPAVPTSFYPGATPISKLINGSGAGAGSTNAPAPTTTLRTTTVATSTRASTTSSSAGGSGGACAAAYGQCGGTGWTGATCCASGSTCTYSNAYYSQCIPS